MQGYNAEVARYFRPPPAGMSRELLVRAGSERQSVIVELYADIADQTLRNVGFRVFACPHIIAACQKAAEMLEGAPVGQLGGSALISLQESLQQEFDIPVEKAGKLLILKDALSVCSAAAGQAEEKE